MPSAYAHYKFGKMVIPGLPKDIKNVIKKYPAPFKAGLQGPDFLFYYRAFSKNKINQIGVSIHHKDFYPFMTHAVKIVNKYGKNSSQYSYLLGLICHYVLDKNCHPYVNVTMDETDCGHIEIEGAFEHKLLVEDGYTPESFPMHHLIPTKESVAESMSPFYNQISTYTIHASLKWMYIIKKFFVAPHKAKRTCIDLLMHATFHYKSLYGHVVEPDSNPRCEHHLDYLYELFENSATEAVYLIQNFNNALYGDVLSNKFRYDFSGTLYF